jgi:hypothetical protein
MTDYVKDIERNLKRPYPPNQIKWRKGRGNTEVAYIDARDVMNRLDSVFGINGWQAAYEWLGERMVCTIACRIGEEWISKADGHGDTDIEPKEGGISKALVRAAVPWGVGRYLYHPKAFDSNRNPASWATPEGYDSLLEEREKASVVKLHTKE